MFYHIEGTVTDIFQQLAVVDCGGVGYALNSTNNTLSYLKIGEKHKFYTYLHVREECFELYGFHSEQEKRFFELLIGVSGVGPKAALSILSASTPDTVMSAIVSENYKVLTAAQGIGKKIAQRIVLELKDKINNELNSQQYPGGDFSALTDDSNSGDKLRDVSAALAALGYTPADISHALKGLNTAQTDVSGLVKEALKNLMK